MSNEEAKGICEQSLNAWEQDNIEILTSKEMGAWLARRDKNREKSGKWIKHSTYKGVLICSHCNHGETQAYDTFKFCPYCGADMRGDV